MAKDYSKSLGNHRFIREMALIIEKVDEYANSIKKEVARRCFNRIVDHEEPRAPLYTGSYIASHRIGINAPDLSYTQVDIKNALTVSEARAIARGYLSVIAQAKPGDSIHLSNSVNKRGFSWAINVEYAGWGLSATSPYHVYEKAMMRTQDEVQQIAQEMAKVLG